MTDRYRVAYTDGNRFHEGYIDANTPMRAMRGFLDRFADGCTMMPVYDGLDVAYWDIIRAEVEEEGYSVRNIGVVREIKLPRPFVTYDASSAKDLYLCPFCHQPMDMKMSVNGFIRCPNCEYEMSISNKARARGKRITQLWEEYNPPKASPNTGVLYRKGLVEDLCQNCGITEGEAEEVIDFLRKEARR